MQPYTLTVVQQNALAKAGPRVDVSRKHLAHAALHAAKKSNQNVHGTASSPWQPQYRADQGMQHPRLTCPAACAYIPSRLLQRTCSADAMERSPRLHRSCAMRCASMAWKPL